MLFSKQDIKRLLIPLIIEQTLAVTIGVVDTLMVASVGEAVVSGVSIVDAINMLLVQVFTALATGGAIVVAQYLGRKEQKNACEAARQLFFVMAIIGAAVAFVCVAFNNSILRLIYKTLEPDVMSSAHDYFMLTALSYPFFAVYNSGAALFRSQGNSRVSMLNALLMNILNIGGNAVFLFGFNMGAMAVGLGTLMARVVGAVIMIVLMLNRNNRVYIESFWPLTIKGKMVRTILRIGVPSGLENGMFHFGKLLLSGLISTFGTSAITANAVANSIATLLCIPGHAMGLAMITVIGQCVGAGQYEQASSYTKQLLKGSYLLGGALNVLALIFMKQIVGVFSLSPETAQLAVICSVIHAAVWLVLWPAAFTLPNSLRAAGDVRFTMLVSVISMWTCRIGMSYVFAIFFKMGLIGVWVAMDIDWLVRAAFFVWRFLSNRWRNCKVV